MQFDCYRYCNAVLNRNAATISCLLLLYRRMHFHAKSRALMLVRLRSSTARNSENLPRGRPQSWGKILTGRFDMWRSRLAFLVMMLLAMGFALCPQDSANAAKFCAQLRGATAAGQPDCSFSTLEACRARVRHRGGGHCYKLTH
jgi:hypothetical protein